MERSYRGLGLVALILLVVAPLSLFAVLALFEDESAGLDPAQPRRRGMDAHGSTGPCWSRPSRGRPVRPGASSSTSRTPARTPSTRTSRWPRGRPTTSSSDGYLSLGAAVDEGTSVPFADATATNDIVIEDLGGGDSVPVTLTATFASTAPIGAALDSQALHLRLDVTGARTDEAGSPSLLDAAGAQLWLAPVFLVAAAAVALIVQARRRARSGRVQ